MGHEENYGNNRADALAKEGRGADAEARPDGVDWFNDPQLFRTERDYRLSKLVVCITHSLGGIPRR